MGWLGGSTRISVEASDTRSLASVHAVVTNPDSSETEIPLEASSFSRFEGLLELPPNFSGGAQIYSVAVFAEDDIGQTTGAYAGTITVEPKGTPHPGHLTLEPAHLHFGPVSIGQKALGSVVLSNTGKRGSPPVSGFLRTSEPQFFLPGASDEGLPFTLKPGEERIFAVGFQTLCEGSAGHPACSASNRWKAAEQRCVIVRLGSEIAARWSVNRWAHVHHRRSRHGCRGLTVKRPTTATII